jgi:hypothetical protein
MLDLVPLGSAAAAARGAALIWRDADRLLPTFASGSHAHLTSSHDPTLVIISVAISVFASYTALDLTGRAHVSEGGKRASWLAAGAAAMGGGIWSMHYAEQIQVLGLGAPLWWHNGTVVGAGLEYDRPIDLQFGTAVRHVPHGNRRVVRQGYSREQSCVRHRCWPRPARGTSLHREFAQHPDPGDGQLERGARKQPPNDPARIHVAGR